VTCFTAPLPAANLNAILNGIQNPSGANMAVRRLAATAVCLALAATLAACGGVAADSGSGEPVAGGTLNVLRANPFEGFELDKQTLNSSYQVSQAVIEPLIRVSEDGTGLEPGLASSWEYSKDNTRLTIELDEAATFSNGDPVTAADVRFSVETWQAGPNYGATYAGITRVEVAGDKTVVLHLAAPDTSLVAFLSWATAGVMPADFAGMSAEDYYQAPIGAGPFTVQEWSPNGEIVLTKNPDYYRDGAPLLDEVVSNYAADPNSVTLQLQSGQADMADEILPVTASTLPEGSAYAGPEHLTPVLVMNTREGALADADVRRGIGYAIDYDGIAEGALKGYATPPEGALPTNTAHWAAPSEAYFSQDLDRSRQLLSGKAPESLALVYPNDASSSVMAQVIQENLADVGIDVELKSTDSATAFGTMAGGDFDMAIFSNNAISPDASDPAWYIVATETMFTGFPTDEAIGILTDYAATDDPAAKEAAITQLQDLWSTEAPYIALAHSPALEGIRDGVHDAHVTPWGTYYLDTVWKSR
jgi:peptide/nickel transport system substrate-binding protein